MTFAAESSPRSPGAAAAELPPELRRWNWGAFFLNWLWGLGNRTPIALLTLLPPLSFVMPFVLGAKGSAWAWRNGRWDSVEQFRRSQRRWAIWGFVLMIPPLLVCLVSVAALTGLLGPINVNSRYVTINAGSDQPGAMAEQAFRASPAVIAALGQPLDGYSSSGSQSMVNGSGEASYNVRASGPKGSGTAALKAQANFGEWSITSFTLASGGGTVDVVPPAPAGARLARAHLTVAGSDTPRDSVDTEQSRHLALSVDYAHKVPGTKVQALLFGPRADDPASLLVRSTVTLDADPQHDAAVFDFDDELAPGAYRIDLAVDGTAVKSLPFTVTAGAAPGATDGKPTDGKPTDGKAP